MHQMTLAEIARGLAEKKFSSEELTRNLLARVAQLDPQLNSFITVTEDLAITQAQAADARRAAGETGPLLGAPLAHKDLFCTKGIRTSCASRMLDNFKAPYDATVVARLAAAGTVTLGKSGGSAAAVAARLLPGATGTDTGGSIRQPAALTNLTGLKPTYGRVSRWGMIAYASSLDQAGPMARTAEDCALLLQGMAGFDVNDSTSIDEPVPDYSAGLNASLQGLRIGVPKEYFGAGLDPRIADLVMASVDELKKLGAVVKEVSLPNLQHAIPAYYVIAPAEASSNLSRFDGVRFGYRCEEPKDLTDLYKRSRGEGFGPEVQRRIMVGAYALSAGYYDAYYLQAQKIRRLIKNDFMTAFAEVDVILGPTTPNPAWKIGAKNADPVSAYLEDFYTITANLAGLPGLSMPAGFADGLPVGVQLLAPYFQEGRLLNVAHQYQQVTDWHTRSPAGF
jgi:aspartyl-tRNA(Asn)/glutamyl-tRNA(Gln) amidotransferase subunit A